MPTRSPLTPEEVASLDNLAAAYHRAARGHAGRADVRRFSARLDEEFAELGQRIRTLDVPVGGFQSFRIFDPKPRVIHAPCFHDRVIHHALMAKMGPVMDRALVADTFACRVGKGALAAVERAQHFACRHAFYVKVYVKSYYASIHHEILQAVLERRFKSPGLLELCGRIIASFSSSEGRGIPIGALTSQHFANLYLDPLDRFLLEDVRVAGMTRYMDDVVWWCRTAAEARRSLPEAADFVGSRLGLAFGPKCRIQRSACGLSFVGFRIFPGTLKLSRRRKSRYQRARRLWEDAYRAGAIDGLGLQVGYAAALATTLHADSAAWRRAELRRRPALDI